MITRLTSISRHLIPRAQKIARMTTNTNKACCTIPAVEGHDYQPKGNFQSVGQFKKVYVTGDATDKALVCVYDIFGFYPQTQQGADLLAQSLKAKVYMPDFFEPDAPFPNEKFPPSTEEDKAALNAFFGGPAAPPKAIKNLTSFAETLKSSGAKQVGAYGFCWGGKVTVNAGGSDTPFTGVAIVHPAMLSAEDAEKLTVPLGIFISNDEPVDEYEKIVKAIGQKPFASKNDSKNYSNMFHGWAAARADLKNAENKKEYEDVYTRLANFFANTWA